MLRPLCSLLKHQLFQGLMFFSFRNNDESLRCSIGGSMTLSDKPGHSLIKITPGRREEDGTNDPDSFFFYHQSTTHNLRFILVCMHRSLSFSLLSPLQAHWTLWRKCPWLRKWQDRLLQHHRPLRSPLLSSLWITSFDLSFWQQSISKRWENVTFYRGAIFLSLIKAEWSCPCFLWPSLSLEFREQNVLYISIFNWNVKCYHSTHGEYGCLQQAVNPNLSLSLCNDLSRLSSWLVTIKYYTWETIKYSVMNWKYYNGRECYPYSRQHCILAIE